MFAQESVMDIKKEKKAIKNLKAFYMEDWNLTEEERDDLDNLVSRIVAVVKTEAQAVPEGFVLVEKAKLMQIIGSVSLIEPITRGNPYMDSVKRELTAITDVVKTVIEAQEQSHE
jgi:hypothetical protein